MAEWSKTQLSDILVDKGYIRGPFGSALKRGDMKENGVPVYEQQHAIYDSRGFRYYIDEQKFVEMKRFQVNTDDLIISCSGTVGKVSIIRDDDPKGIISQALLLLRVDKNKILPLYLKYFFSSRDGYNAIVSRSSGSVQVNIAKRDVIEQIPLMLPKIETQRKIVGVLNSIDKKIDENERINKNLEQQVQAIFLKMFPDIFSTPASSSFQNLIEFTNGKKRPETIGDIPVYGGNGVLAYTNQSNAENCVIIGRVGAYCGNTFLCPEKCWTSDNAIQAKSKNEDSPLFIYYLLRNASLPSRHIGTGQPLMTQAILNAIPVNEPSTQEIRSFINICTPLNETIFANEKQNILLAILRDTLLPKLMSGQIDVSDIDL